MKLKEREDLIFCKYREQGEPIVSDGAISDEYERARIKLLVVLKEHNDPSGNWSKSGGDIRGFGNWGGRAATWNNLARWSALVDNPLLCIDEIDVSDRQKRAKHLHRIAVVNLKTTPGGNRANNKMIK